MSLSHLNHLVCVVSADKCVCVCVSFQNVLSSQVLVDGLAPADRPILGVLRVWGVGSTTITAATLKSGSVEHKLTPQHNVETQVSRDQTSRSFSLQMLKFTSDRSVLLISFF